MNERIFEHKQRLASVLSKIIEWKESGDVLDKNVNNRWAVKNQSSAKK